MTGGWTVRHGPAGGTLGPTAWGWADGPERWTLSGGAVGADGRDGTRPDPLRPAKPRRPDSPAAPRGSA
ncbi:hypothetical protein, partial [Streptomyces sp. NRRL WC-3719]|uniref:hypothetical protein n=1 Tax=Streptomyces sp. NRRL WC-3719 TaxID=1463932 RepID=UPI00056C87C4